MNLFEKMSSSTKASVVRQIMFPEQLYDLVKIRLEQLGVSTPEYVRQLVIEDVKPLYKDLHTIDKSMESSLANAFEDVRQGKVKRFKDYSSAQTFLDSVSKEGEDE